jgi:hypothetical protein
LKTLNNVLNTVQPSRRIGARSSGSGNYIISSWGMKNDGWQDSAILSGTADDVMPI